MADTNTRKICEAERECVLSSGKHLRPERKRKQGPGMLHHLQSSKRQQKRKDIQESEMTGKPK